jgi:hypothetical protein
MTGEASDAIQIITYGITVRQSTGTTLWLPLYLPFLARSMRSSPLNAIVITSRTEPALGAVDRTTLSPIRLAAGTLVPFIIGYLDRMDAAGELRDDAIQLQLAERIVDLAKSGGQKTAVTPLLVTLFVGSALRRVQAGRSCEDLPKGVPEMFVDYMRGLNATPNPDAPISDDAFIRAAQTVGTVSLGKN